MDKMMFHPIQSKAVSKPKPTSVNQILQSNNKFSVHFQHALQTDSKLTVSKHAKERLLQRGIHINEARWNQIEEKVQEAKNKGVKESLVLLKDAALIVSAKNNTVITAMDREEARTQIFTNINGTILLDQ
ncbi:TIGR02530 family flagellar biosynthesis protein [Cytobacillus solani]|uniref:Flagellar protein n=1 Tax=Cytobacillus solani TaxID=1637975 RepID=A0A0Q3VHN8_9BACI|nr:TIGR02530 family flagellar biosynthesis protein [Cytobacillus solani]KOP82140.1 flagellar protein [Bacillus sp. FJAT-21945]KQL19119.1 flagellar protein [Cytobacillus solani]USK57017.1 flagellar protein [Cytobacillus solani]